MATVAKFYEGTYIFKVGYPILFVVASPVEGDEFVGDGFLLLRKPPNLADFYAGYAEVSVHMSARNLEECGIQNAQEYVAASTKRHLEGRLLKLQFEQYDKSKEVLALRQSTFEERLDWQRELLTLRLQGLPEKLITQMSEQVHDDEVGRVISKLKYVPVITVRDVE